METGEKERTFHSVELSIGSKGIEVLFDRFLTKGQSFDSPRMHVHPAPYYEIVFFLSGSWEILTDGGSRAAPAGSLSIVPPGLSHRLIISPSAAEAGASCATFILLPGRRAATDREGREAERLFHSDGAILLLPHMDDCRQFFEKIAREITEKGPCCGQMLKLLLEELLISVIRSLPEPAAWGAERQPEETDRTRMLQIESYLERTVRGSGGSLQGLADELFLSGRQVERLVRKLYGKSFRDCLYEMRMEYAAQLLESGRSVQETASLLSYCSVNAFHAAFRNYYRVPPMRYVRMKNG